MPYKKISARLVLTFALGFWLTAVFMRLIIFWAFLHGRTPAIYIRSHHVHHFIFGLAILLITGILYYYSTLPGRLLLLLAGIGSGLMFDEFLYWTRGTINYWSLYNFCALAVGGVACLFVYFYAKRQNLGINIKLPDEKHSFHWVTAPFALSLLFLYCLFLMQHTMVAQAAEKRSLKFQIKALEHRAKEEIKQELVEYKIMRKK